MQSYAVLLAGVDLLASLSCLFVASVAWRRRTAPAAHSFFVLALALSWWCGWSIPVTLGADSELTYASIRLSWLGVAIASPAYLAFATQYGGGEVNWSWRWVLLLGVEPALTILAILTNDWLHLMWTVSPSERCLRRAGNPQTFAGSGPAPRADGVPERCRRRQLSEFVRIFRIGATPEMQERLESVRFDWQPVLAEIQTQPDSCSQRSSYAAAGRRGVVLVQFGAQVTSSDRLAPA